MTHIFLQDADQPVPVSNIFCIGRNYAAHITELGNQQEKEPLVFLKPTTAIHLEGTPVDLPTFSDDVHYETELVILIGKKAKNIPYENALEYIQGYGLGLDLTARDLQTAAKSKGLPWTLAKGFDQSACLSRFIPADAASVSARHYFSMKQNGQLKQTGDTALMLFDISALISYLSEVFTLSAGDLIFTGTPEGVGKLYPGDVLELEMTGKISARFSVAQ
jgi:2-keto-4-pentenoate hydratase/2-oxohepta-3-ene-1,7-dioic acid hydratase in catechol pathway